MALLLIISGYLMLAGCAVWGIGIWWLTAIPFFVRLVASLIILGCSATLGIAGTLFLKKLLGD